MKFKVITLFLGLLLYNLSMQSAELESDLTAPIPILKTREGSQMIHSQIYHKLLKLSQTFRNQHELTDTSKNINLTYCNKDHTYYSIDRKLPLSIANYITASNTQKYIENLSLHDAVKLYQEADFWEFDTRTLDHLCAAIAGKLYNNDALTRLMTDKEKFNQFIALCNPVTQDALSQALSGYLWSIVAAPTQTLQEHQGRIKSLAVNSKDTLFSSSDDQSIKVWKLNEQEDYNCVQTLTGHTCSVDLLATYDNKTLFSASRYNKDIKIWKLDEHNQYICAQTLTNNTKVTSIAVHPDGTLVSGLDDGVMTIWKPDEQGQYTCVQSLEIKPGSIDSVEIDIEGTLFSISSTTKATPYKTTIIKTWKLDQNKQYICTQTLSHDKKIQSLIAHSDGTLFLAAPLGESVEVWKANDCGQYVHTQTLKGYTSVIPSIAIDKSSTLFLNSINNSIEVWKANDCGQYVRIQILAAHTELINAVMTNAQGTLFSGSYDNTIKVWKLPCQLLSLEQHLLSHWLYNNYKGNSEELSTLPEPITKIIQSQYNYRQLLSSNSEKLTEEKPILPYQVILKALRQYLAMHIAEIEQEKPLYAISKFGPNGCFAYKIIPGLKTLTPEEQEAIKGLAAGVYNWYKEALIVRRNGLTAELQNRLETLHATIMALTK